MWDFFIETDHRKMQIKNLPKIEWEHILLEVKQNEGFSHPKSHTSDLIGKVFPYKQD